MCVWHGKTRGAIGFAPDPGTGQAMNFLVTFYFRRKNDKPAHQIARAHKRSYKPISIPGGRLEMTGECAC